MFALVVTIVLVLLGIGAAAAVRSRTQKALGVPVPQASRSDAARLIGLFAVVAGALFLMALAYRGVTGHWPTHPVYYP